MWNVFKGTLAVLVRNKDIFIWSLAFPLVLATMFMFMFAGFDEETSFKPVRAAIVDDANYKADDTFSQLIESLGSAGESQLLDIREYSSAGAAKDALANGEVFGVLSVDATGSPLLQIAAASDVAGIDQVNQTILKTVVDTYERNEALLLEIAAENPLAFADPAAIADALTHRDATVEVSLTHSTPSLSVRYYYALLGMAALFCAQIGLTAIGMTQPNLSALGARRALGATGRGKTLAATLLASWVVAFCCLVVAFAYIRFVVGVDFAGRDGLCIVALGATALFTTAFGTFLGALPKISMNMKSGLLTVVVLVLSLFAGLFGEPAMELADQVARDYPALAALNPARVVTDAFYSLYFYDSLTSFLENVGILAIMCAVFLAISVLFIRRQRYASL